MAVLVTRPLEDAERTAAELRARGYDAIIAPLLAIRFVDGPEIALDNVQAILATSANGVRALIRRTKRRDIPLFAVGPQTAEAARDAGFTSVRSADGDAAKLAEVVKQWATPSAGTLFHPAGAQTKGSLAETLTAAGFTLRSEILYSAAPIPSLPPEAVKAMGSGKVDAVVLYSPRSARVFVDAVRSAGLIENCHGIAALCISQATADALAPLVFCRVAVAAGPDQEGVLALLD